MKAIHASILSCLAAAAIPGCLRGDSEGGEDDPPACESTPAAEVNVVINEIMASNAVTITDAKGNAGDWVELYNPDAEDVSLCGYGITDDFAEPHKAFLDEDAVVPGGGHLLIWLSGDLANGQANHAEFRLAAEGGEVGLADADGAFVSHVSYGAQATDFSAAREPDGSDAWIIEWHASPGEANPDGDGAPLGARDPAGPPEEVPAAGDLTEEILGYDVVLELGIRVEPDQVARLEASPREYVPAYLIYDGREYGPVGLRLKGVGSFRPFDEKPSFRINIDEYADPAKFFGLDDLTLNNMTSDFSMVHERLAYLVARHVGPASRANHAVLTVNDQHYGLYINVETVKWHMLERWFEDSGGPLFEGTDVDFASEYIDLFEHESGPDDRSKLQALADALANPDPDAALEAARAHVDLDAFLDFWAMEGIVAQFDALPYSAPGDDFFVYVDPTSQKLWFLPWGMDESFYSGERDVREVTSVLASTCLRVTSCAQDFEERVWAMVQLIEDIDLLGELERVTTQIAPHVAADGRKAYSDAEVEEFQMQLFWFIQSRREIVEEMFADEI